MPVFLSGTDGYSTFRIPAIIKAPNGNLLAFCEGRVHGEADFGDIDIVMKTSRDNGTTWTSLNVLVDVQDKQAGNPAPVADLTDPAYPKGRIFLFYNTGNNHEQEVRKGNGLRECWYITSSDNGITWSSPVNITTQVHRPKQPLANPVYNFQEDWRSYANTPGHALQFERGPYKGRLLIAANHSQGDPKQGSADYSAHCYYSDDHGRSFHLGASLNMPGSNESTAALLSDGRLLMNSRNQKGDIKARIVSFSHDGGARWDTTYFDQNLPDPVNEGSLLAIDRKKGPPLIAFSNAADTIQRNNLTVRFSNDGGRSWQQSRHIYSGIEKGKDYSAYSDIVQLNETTVGILFEKDDYSSIVFATTVIK